MFSVELYKDDFLRDLRDVERRFTTNMTHAVMRTAQIGLEKIVQRTNEPPIPRARVYKRTNRLISGWIPAGKFLDVNVPAAKARAEGKNEGSFDFRNDKQEVSFVARNNVPYALFVELTGTWIVPPPNQVRRAPYLMAGNTIKEMESAQTLERQVEHWWDVTVTSL